MEIAEDAVHSLVPVLTTSGIALVRAVLPADSGGPTDIADAETRMADLLATVRSGAAELVSALQGLNLSSIEAEFGIQFAVKSGKLVTAFVEAGSDCAFKVTLRWTSPTAVQA